jgi:hypothetical protein
MEIVLWTHCRYSWRRQRTGQLKIGKITAHNKISASKRTVRRTAGRRKTTNKVHSRPTEKRQPQGRAGWSRPEGKRPKGKG